eukprot:584384-Pleurochrysis_carterae.AAC.1
MPHKWTQQTSQFSIATWHVPVGMLLGSCDAAALHRAAHTDSVKGTPRSQRKSSTAASETPCAVQTKRWYGECCRACGNMHRCAH